MTSAEIRSAFLNYFAERSHTIVPSSPVVPYDDPTLLFANAGMNQFKDVFLGAGSRSYTRAADTQKCIRVSGKHNDLEEVGRDTYHHTFFEMLGNWSFGDYYKKEAIGWAWDLLTRVWGLPKERLWATVYKDDDEAERLWKSVTDIAPDHVLRFGEKDNFWEMGETGPCGPCSEIHIDRTPQGNATAEMVNAGLAAVMEIWNLVFIQYNRDEAGVLTPLPSKHVDTGMGFERICAVLQGKNSNYDTDVFSPLIGSIADVTGRRYDGRMDGSPLPAQAEADVAMRVIADHVRTLTFAIGDGALPSNEGRGYVLRRILRRASRFGRNLGIHDPFIYRLVPTLVETMSHVFPEIRTNQEHIQRVIKGEEEGFNATLDRGLEKFESVVRQIGHSKTFPGDDAFRLYDTYGFPLDLTELMATERGLTVDVAAFTQLMEEQKERSRAGTSAAVDASTTGDRTTLTDPEVISRVKEYAAAHPAEFLGYDRVESAATVTLSGPGFALLDRTPFYAESGGQIGDTGELIAVNRTYRVLNTVRLDTAVVHVLEDAAHMPTGTSVQARVDAERRASTMRNHSATHLLHNALRRTLGTHVHQAGSLVAPDYFRFDYAHFARLSDQELSTVEELVNAKIREDLVLMHHRNIPFDQAKTLGALMFFGYKYGDRVNVVQFGDFSMEFCGGTHVRHTADIGYFKIRSEGSVASGVRRIEAVTHQYALELLRLDVHAYQERLQQAAAQVGEIVRLRADAGESPSADLSAIAQSLENLRYRDGIPEQVSPELANHFSRLAEKSRALDELLQRVADQRKSAEKEIARKRLSSLSGSVDEMVNGAQDVRGVRVVSREVTVGTADELKSLGDALRARLGSGVGLLGSVLDGKVQLVCVVTDDLVAAKRIEAGKVVGEAARIVGGGGGGRPHMATAGGKDASKLADALAQAPSIVQRLLK